MPCFAIPQRKRRCASSQVGARERRDGGSNSDPPGRKPAGRPKPPHTRTLAARGKDQKTVGKGSSRPKGGEKRRRTTPDGYNMYILAIA